MDTLTPRQAEILEFIQEAVEQNGCPPTLAEIARRFNFRSPNAAVQHLKALARKGAIGLIPGTSRGIRLSAPQGLPLIGRVAAGSPILSEANIQTHYRIDPALFRRGAEYLLRVRGMSMRDAGILEGDLLAVHRASEVRSGQIVVVRLHDEVTVKRWLRRGSQTVLKAENPEYQDIVIDPGRDAVSVEGICVGVIRQELD